MLRICVVDIEYADDLAALWALTFKQAYRSVHSEANLQSYCDVNFTLDAARKSLSDPKVQCTVAFREEAAVGYSLLNHRPCPIPVDAESSELKQIYIVESEYGSGLGKYLFDGAVKKARAFGSACIWLSVSDFNHRAPAFYRKLAFNSLGDGPTFEVGSDRLTSTIMARDI